MFRNSAWFLNIILFHSFLYIFFVHNILFYLLLSAHIAEQFKSVIVCTFFSNKADACVQSLHLLIMVKLFISYSGLLYPTFFSVIAFL